MWRGARGVPSGFGHLFLKILETDALNLQSDSTYNLFEFVIMYRNLPDYRLLLSIVFKF